ncbi:MAG TPA: hypothetical protein VNM48_03740 [Chloroflexota bacterium]|nr:hypothetical protein [Chloroflexota bacterium]
MTPHRERLIEGIVIAARNTVQQCEDTYHIEWRRTPRVIREAIKALARSVELLATKRETQP